MEPLANLSLLRDEDEPTLVQTLFPDPDSVSQGEYITIYEFLQNPDICNDPAMIAGCLEEFIGWGQYMLDQMRKHGRLEARKEAIE
jgi:hypothetical protein